MLRATRAASASSEVTRTLNHGTGRTIHRGPRAQNWREDAKPCTRPCCQPDLSLSWSRPRALAVPFQPRQFRQLLALGAQTHPGVPEVAEPQQPKVAD